MPKCLLSESPAGVVVRVRLRDGRVLHGTHLGAAGGRCAIAAFGIAAPVVYALADVTSAGAVTLSWKQYSIAKREQSAGRFRMVRERASAVSVDDE
ncbi:MAG TPA: hypothetical protein VIY73_05500 [Polyangiaceae bacterium]